MCSLAEHATQGYSHTFTGERIGRTQLDLWSRGLREFTAARAKYDQAQFVDVDFADLRADPLGTVGRVYDAIGADLTDDARSAMTALDAESASGDRRPQHRYALEDYGLTADEVRAAFAD